ncbi:MAG: class I SAM-dependent methyltransferase [Candidatus Woesearchaeota archaeon]
MGLAKAYLSYLYGNVTRSYEKALISSLEKNPKAILVDAGCWDGANTLRFVQATGAKAIGLDLVESAVASTRRKGIEAMVADLNKRIPLKDSTADVVMVNHTIEHLYNTAGFVSEIYRILKPGGYALIGTPNLASWHNIFALLLGRQPFSGPTIDLSEKSMVSGMKQEKNRRLVSGLGLKAEDALGHIVVIAYKTLLKLLRSKGFIVEKAYGFGYYPLPPFIAGLLASLDKSHSHYVLVKVRKPA